MKTIAIKDRTWHKLTKLKNPGETFDQLCNRLMDIEAGERLVRELKKLDEEIP